MEKFDFIDYVSEFYQEDKGLYAEDFSPRVKRSEIEAATNGYLETLKEKNEEFVGDSVDRECIRTILEAARDIVIMERKLNDLYTVEGMMLEGGEEHNAVLKMINDVRGILNALYLKVPEEYYEAAEAVEGNLY